MVNNTLKPQSFSENDFYVGQKYWENIYVRSKFEAENLILHAGNKGLNFTIYRMGNLTGRLEDGHFQKNIKENAFYSALKTIFTLGFISEELSKHKIEFTPIDLASIAVVKMFDCKEFNKRIFHISNHNVLTVSDMVELLKKIDIKIKILPKNAQIEKLNCNDTSGISQIYIDSQGNLINKAVFELKTDITCKCLEQVGFNWNVVDVKYIEKLVNYMREVKYID